MGASTVLTQLALQDHHACYSWLQARIQARISGHSQWLQGTADDGLAPVRVSVYWCKTCNAWGFSNSCAHQHSYAHVHINYLLHLDIARHHPCCDCHPPIQILTFLCSNKYFETFSYLPPLSDNEIAKQV